MFSHILVDEIGAGEATVVILGDAVFTHAQEMQAALSQALDACEHLTIDVGSVDALDLNFRVLLCSLHRRSELVNKKISMRGALPGLEDDRTRYDRVKGCLFKKPNERCMLWESMIGDGAEGRRSS